MPIGGNGGITHIDIGSLKWLYGLGIKNLLDVGCSVGWQINEAINIGIDAYGVEGDINIINNSNTKNLERIFFCDLTKSYVKFPLSFDAIWCVEVAEHIEEQYIDNLFITFSKNIKLNGILVFTHSLVEAPHVHVNIKPSSYWINKMKDYGLYFNLDKTKDLKWNSTMQREFIQNTGMVFVRGN